MNMQLRPGLSLQQRLTPQLILLMELLARPCLELREEIAEAVDDNPALETVAAVSDEARLLEHQRGRASKYTRSRLPVSLVWSVRVRTWSAALRRELRIKGMTRAAKEELLRAKEA